jgi:hypothetical protein
VILGRPDGLIAAQEGEETAAAQLGASGLDQE